MKNLILINSTGAKYDLFDSAASPTYELEGLGYTDETDFLRIGNSFYALDEASAQRTLEMTLSFYNGADDKYYAFVDFARRDPLTLQYENDRGTFFFPVRMRSIAKPDQPRFRQFSCPVTFAVMGNPYKIVSRYNDSETETGKVYNYTYPYTYSSDLLNTVRFYSDSYVESPCILTIYGEAVNPIWRHYVNGTLAETGAYSGTLESGHYLVIDAKSMPYSIIEYDSSGTMVADRYALCDFSTERFLHANEGINSYVVSHDGTDAVALKMEAYIQYETV